MKKVDELNDKSSCLNRAKDDELVFVLLGRDVAMPETLRFWARLRISEGKNTETDLQITEALALADKVAAQQRRSLLALLPCPFCGCDDCELIETTSLNAIAWAGYCPDCRAKGGPSNQKSIAAQIWNMRPKQ